MQARVDANVNGIHGTYGVCWVILVSTHWVHNMADTVFPMARCIAAGIVYRVYRISAKLSFRAINTMYIYKHYHVRVSTSNAFAMQQVRLHHRPVSVLTVGLRQVLVDHQTTSPVRYRPHCFRCPSIWGDGRSRPAATGACWRSRKCFLLGEQRTGKSYLHPHPPLKEWWLVFPWRLEGF